MTLLENALPREGISGGSSLGKKDLGEMSSRSGTGRQSHLAGVVLSQGPVVGVLLYMGGGWGGKAMAGLLGRG